MGDATRGTVHTTPGCVAVSEIHRPKVPEILFSVPHYSSSYIYTTCSATVGTVWGISRAHIVTVYTRVKRSITFHSHMADLLFTVRTLAGLPL